MYKHLKLPPFLEVKKCTGGGPRKVGLFAKEPIERGTRLITREIHTAGISGKTVSDIRSVCHNCLAKIGDATPVVCRDCKIASYCSIECLQAARSLHAIECNGIISLEKLRGKVALDIPRPSSWPIGYEDYWPPAHALLAARVINKGVMNIDQDASDWIDYISIPEVLPPSKVKVFSQLEEYVRLLVPEVTSDTEIKQSLLAISVNASTVEDRPVDTSIIALYNVEYYLLNHLCKPNCEVDKDGEIVTVYTIDDIETGTPLGISFVSKEYYMNVRELRRAKLKECFGFDCNCYICQGETVPGSKLWQLEKQKSSLIAPWSFSMARETMVSAWGVLCECEPLIKVSPLYCIEKLELSLEKQRLILDPHNVMFIITAITLLLRYCQVNDGENAVDIYYEHLDHCGTQLIMDYGTRKDIAEIAGNICIRLFDLEQISEFHKMFQLTRQVHPRRPSAEALCDILQLDDVPEQLSSEDVEVDEEMTKMFQIYADQFGIPREMYEEIFRQFVGQYDQRPSLAQMLEAIQDVFNLANTN